MTNLLPLYTTTNPDGELSPQICLLSVPKRGLVILIRVAEKLEINCLIACGMVVGRHCSEDRLRGDESFIVSDAGAKANDVRGAFLINGCNGGDARFVLALHANQLRFRVVWKCVDVDEFVVLGAQQHEVLQVLREKRRTDGIASGTVWHICDNVRDEAEFCVPVARHEIPDEIIVATAVLAAACRSCPEC